MQEILCLGDPDVASSLGIARVTNTPPASTNAGVNVRVLSGPSSLADFSVRAVLPSTAADNPVSAAQASTVWAVQVHGRVRAQNSTQGDFVGQFAAISASGVSMSTDTGPASTVQGLIVRQVGFSTTVNVSSLAGVVNVQQNSTVWAIQADGRVRAQNSTILDLLASVQQNSTVWAIQADGRVRAQNSTILDFLASVQQNSTVWQVQAHNSSIADLLASAQQNSTVWQVQAHNSTIGDLLASVQQNSTVWQTQAKIMDSSAVSPNIVGTRPTTGAQGFAVRTVLNDLQSTAFSTIGNGSTSATVVSSVASQRIKVYAYSITSTAQAVNTLTFASSLGNAIWHIQMQSVSSGISGANLAVSPPAWLFGTAANEPLVFKVTGTTGSYHLSFSYFVEA